MFYCSSSLCSNLLFRLFFCFARFFYSSFSCFLCNLFRCLILLPFFLTLFSLFVFFLYLFSLLVFLSLFCFICFLALFRPISFFLLFFMLYFSSIVHPFTSCLIGCVLLLFFVSSLLPFALPYLPCHVHFFSLSSLLHSALSLCSSLVFLLSPLPASRSSRAPTSAQNYCLLAHVLESLKSKNST